MRFECGFRWLAFNNNDEKAELRIDAPYPRARAFYTKIITKLTPQKGSNIFIMSNGLSL